MGAAPSKPAVVALLAVLVAALAAPSGCARREAGPRRPRLVLLYATCTLNREHLGPYNAAVPYTPALSTFAHEATVFLRHQTETGQSGPAYASIFSGAQTDRHGVYRQPSRLRDDLYLLAEAFADHGYDTHFWSGHPMASPELNYGQGVRSSNLHVGGWDQGSLIANDPEFAAILARLRNDPMYRAFVQVNFTITHAPYTGVSPETVAELRGDHPDEWPDLPDADLTRFTRLYHRNRPRLQWDFPAFVRERRLSPAAVRGLALTLDLHYKARVRLLDRDFGRLSETIRAAGVLEDSLIAFTADHGETLYREHTLFKWTHGYQLVPDVIQVPLIVRLAGRRGLAAYPGVSRSIDVYPTLAGLSGFRAHRGVEGVDLSAALLGRERPPALRAFSHTTPLTPELVAQFRGWLVSRLHPSTDVELVWTAVRDGDTYARLRRSEGGRWSVEAFDLARDPGAARDIFDPANPLHRDLARELKAYKARLVARHAQHQREESLPEAHVRERLKSLGYLDP